LVSLAAHIGEVQSTAVDADEVAAVSLTGKYQEKLKLV
jgi:hypothetical protein